MTKYSNRAVTYTVRIIKGSDNQDSITKKIIDANAIISVNMYFNLKCN